MSVPAAYDYSSYDVLPDPCAVVVEGRVVYANPAWTALLGRDARGEAIGRVLRRAPATFPDAEARRLELQVSRGDRVFLDVRAADLRGAAQLLVGRDVTDLELRLDAMGRLARLHAGGASAALVSLEALVAESRPIFLALDWSVSVFERLPSGDAVRLRANVMVQGGAAQEPDGPYREVLSGAPVPLDVLPGVAQVLRTRAPAVFDDIPAAAQESTEQRGDADLARVRRDALAAAEVLTGLAVPVRVDGDVNLVLTVVGPLVTERDVVVVELLAAMISASEQVASFAGSLAEQERRLALSQMAAQLAHEVRNPLAVLFQAGRQLRKRVAPATEGPDLLAMIDEETHRLRMLVDDLVRYAAPGRARSMAVSLAELTRWTAQSLVAEAPSVFENVQLRIEVPDTVAVEADPGMLRHVLANLLFHGAVHAGPGQEVVVSAAPDARDREAMCVCVRSTGPALGAEAERRAFEPFFATRAGGSGLGLAVVRRLVEEQHGRVAIGYEPSDGLSLSIWLPRAAGDSKAVRSLERRSEAT